MLTNWKVLQYVANRYGKYQYSFEESENKLELAREGRIPMMDLEEDTDRMQKRLSREGTSMTAFIERIIGETNFIDKYVLDKLVSISQGVCRLTKNGSAVGTGFLVSENIILTNHHVISEPSEANDMFAEFNFELDEFLSYKKRSCFKLNAQSFFLTSSLKKNNAVPHSGLDFTFIGIEKIGQEAESISDFKPILLDGKKGKIIKGESCVIIQHPNGLPKKIVLKDTAFFSETNTKIIYESDTLPGSSGSVVVALGTCEVIALHHCGLPKTDDQDRVLTKNDTIATPYTPDNEIAWIGNAGIKISKIMEAVREAKLPEQMGTKREALLKRTIEGGEALNIKTTLASEKNKITPDPNKINETYMDNNGYKDFLITANNNEIILSQIDAILKVRYGIDFRFHLAMPASAIENKIELFILQVKTERAVYEEEKELAQIPGIVNAEADIPLAVNADSKFLNTTNRNSLTESALEIDDGFGEPNEKQFLCYYRDEKKSKYLVDKEESECRKWNWEATNFHKVIGVSSIDPYKEGIRIVQFDTGYSDHSKVLGGFDLFNDYNFLKENAPDDARDEMDLGILRQPGHGTRTGSLLIGNDFTTIPSNGNCGLLEKYKYKLVPYRIAKSVILIKRQRQLAEALDMAISQGFDIITMSMGLPPTIATAKMAKKAYDNGIIWCCAAGNEVQFVIAPAVFPGTIAVAASNPLDEDWSGSSRGTAVDITAPGQAVYVPILFKDGNIIKEEFSYGDGTSYATPHVAAAAAFWLAKYKSELNKKEYNGWKRVEAFRQSLRTSGRRYDNNLPKEGFGAGMLDVEKLLNTKPLAPVDLDQHYAYNNWNEHAFFATIQGLSEVAKTYWNRLHQFFPGTPRGGQEALTTEIQPLSPFSRQLEEGLFGRTLKNTESGVSMGYETTLDRLKVINNLIETASKR